MSDWQIHNNDNSAEEVEAEIRERIEDFKRNVRMKIYQTIDWITYHPQEAATIAGTLIFAWRKVDKYVDIHRETKLRNSMIYDRSLGMYWHTKKPLTANQRLMIETRHKAGESYGKILSDMKVLKR